MKINEYNTFQVLFSVTLKRTLNLHLTNFVETLYSASTENKKSPNSVGNQSFS